MKTTYKKEKKEPYWSIWSEAFFSFFEPASLREAGCFFFKEKIRSAKQFASFLKKKFAPLFFKNKQVAWNSKKKKFAKQVRKI